MVANRCDVAHAVDLENDVNSYTNTTCSSQATIDENVEDIAIGYKIINQNFEVERYKEEGTQESYVTRRGANSLFKTMSMVEKLSVVKNYIQFFEKKFIGLSALTFLPALLDMSIFNVNLKLFGHNFYAAKLITDPSFGYFTLVFVQSGQSNDIVWAVRTIQGIFGDVGGYSSVIIGSVAWLLSSYQHFYYNMSFMKRLYSQKKTEDHVHQRRTDSEEMIEKINNRKNFHFGYLRYLWMGLIDHCFRCLNIILRRPHTNQKNEYRRF